MTSKQINFFTLSEDIKQIFIDIEATGDFRYYLSGLFDSKDIFSCTSIFQAPDFGFTSSGDWNRIDRYLMMGRETELNVRNIPQRSGGVKFAVDQMVNAKSIEVKIGGIYLSAGNVIVAGRIATVSQDEFSSNVYSMLSNAIKKKFKKVDGFYVGNNALNKLKEGWRLVISDKSPREYDLSIPG